MTRDEILSMQAGCEMDALIAKVVFGNTKNSWDWEFTLPSYSTGIAAAWQVVEKLRTLGAWISVSITPGAFTWDVRGVINEGQRGEKRFINHAPTPQLAICRAALLAVMEE